MEACELNLHIDSCVGVHIGLVDRIPCLLEPGNAVRLQARIDTRSRIGHKDEGLIACEAGLCRSIHGGEIDLAIPFAKSLMLSRFPAPTPDSVVELVWL